MVRFEDKKLVIEIEVSNQRQAIEKWLNLNKELLYIMRWMNQDSISEHFYVIPDFVDNLLLDYEQVVGLVE